MSDADAISTASVFLPSWYQRRRRAGALTASQDMMSAPSRVRKPWGLCPMITWRERLIAAGRRRTAYSRAPMSDWAEAARGWRTEPMPRCAWTRDSILMSPELCSMVVYVRTYSSTACLPLQPALGGDSMCEPTIDPALGAFGLCLLPAPSAGFAGTSPASGEEGSYKRMKKLRTGVSTVKP